MDPNDYCLYGFNSTIELGPLHIDYLYFHRCIMKDYPGLSYLVLVTWLTMLFYLIGNTADVYFCPTLTSLSDKLKLPYDIAGVTLLAFGNGAPDVFSSIAAFSSGSPDTALNALLGAGVFITTVVVGCIVLTSEVHVSSRAFIRDTSAYLVALVFLVTLGCMKSLSIQECLIFPFLYLTYVFVVALGDIIARCSQHRQVCQDEPCGHVMSAFWFVDDNDPGQQDSTSSKYKFVTRDEAEVTIESEEDSLRYEMSEPMLTKSGQYPTEFPAAMMDDYFARTLSSDDKGDLILTEALYQFDADLSTKNSSGRVWESLYWSYMRWRRATKHQLMKKWRTDPRILSRSIMLLELPSIVVRDLTIPSIEKDTWSRLMFSFMPITCPGFVLITSGYFSCVLSPNLLGTGATLTLGQASIIFGIPISILLLALTHRSRPPTNWLVCMIALTFAFAACISWVYLIANELVALLAAIGKLANISDSVMGQTVLACGNSVGDLMTNISVAKAGFPQMAIAGCFGGPLFNLLVGLGFALVLAASSRPSHTVELHLDMHVITSLVALGIILPATVFVLQRNNYNFPKSFGYALIAGYGVFSLINALEMYFL